MLHLAYNQDRPSEQSPYGVRVFPQERIAGPIVFSSAYLPCVGKVSEAVSLQRSLHTKKSSCLLA